MEQQIRKAHRNIDLLNQQARAIIKAAEELREFVMHVEERLESPKKHTLNSYTQ